MQCRSGGPSLFVFVRRLILHMMSWDILSVSRHARCDFSTYFRVWPHGDRRLYRLGIKVDYGGMDERYAMNKTIASRLNDPCSVIAALR